MTTRQQHRQAARMALRQPSVSTPARLGEVIEMAAIKIAERRPNHHDAIIDNLAALRKRADLRALAADMVQLFRTSGTTPTYRAAVANFTRAVIDAVTASQ